MRTFHSLTGLTAEYPTQYAETNKFKLKHVIYSKQYFSFLKRDSRIKYK